MSADMCRTCLSTENLCPIFKIPSRHYRYSIALLLTTGHSVITYGITAWGGAVKNTLEPVELAQRALLKIEMQDGLPQEICSACAELVNSALLLRNQSHRSEIKFLQLGYARKLIINDKTPHEAHPLINDGDSTTPNLCTKSDNDSYDEDWHSYDDFSERNVKIENKTSIKIENLENNAESEVTNCTRKRKHALAHNTKKKKPFAYSKELLVDSNDSTPRVATKRVPKIPSKATCSRKEKKDLYLSFVDGRFERNGPIRCRVCKKSVNKWSSFMTHTKVHLGFDYVCEFCGKSFISSTQLNRHCRSYHGMKRELPCKYCDYLALDKTQLTLHERRVHTGERPFQCDSCGASYFSRRCLIQHIENHSTVKSIKCVKCQQLFKSRRHLARHTYSIHRSKEFSYKCPVCSQIYKNFKYIRVHLRKQHKLTTKEAKIVKIKL